MEEAILKAQERLFQYQKGAIKTFSTKFIKTQNP